MPATAHVVITDGAVTLIVWLADGIVTDERTVRSRRDMATMFLRSGENNDIYDMMTIIFGEPWGPHNYPGKLIPAEAANQIHILEYDSRYSGYYYSVNNYLDTSLDDGRSNERLMFYTAPDNNISTWVHEYQHLVHFYQKKVKHDYQPRLESWLNEMVSDVASFDLLFSMIEDWSASGLVSWSGPNFSTYNCNNYLRAFYWEYGSSLDGIYWYEVNHALGAYLARNYGGAPLFRDIVQNSGSGIGAIEDALRSQGSTDSADDVLTNWAIATLLSDDPQAPYPYRYNTVEPSIIGGVTFVMKPINLYNIGVMGRRPCGGSPFTFTVAEFNSEGAQAAYSNRYVFIGRDSGTIRLRLRADYGNRFTVGREGRLCRRRRGVDRLLIVRTMPTNEWAVSAGNVLESRLSGEATK